MAAVSNKELLFWYLVTLKLKETFDSMLAKSQPTSPSGNQDQPLLLPPPPTPPTLPPTPPTLDSEWIIQIREKLDQAEQEEKLSHRLSVYRMPKTLRDGRGDKTYVPQLVSLGPYHHGKKHVHDMERHKWRAFHHTLKRSGHKIERYLKSIKKLEKKTRARYEGNISMSSNKFVGMMVLDGIFILEVFRGVAREGFEELGYAHNDPVFTKRGMMHYIQRDMIMLENQIPLFVLDRILAIQIGRPENSGLVAKLAVKFFDSLMPTDEPLIRRDRGRWGSVHNQIEEPSKSFDPLSERELHCLDVFRHSLLRMGPQPLPRIWNRRKSHNHRVPDKRRQQLIHCVTELKEAGIKFKRRKTDRFWDIKYKNGVLGIPCLFIQDGTKSLFLNLIAFEQCHMDRSNHITSYAVFMDSLINSDKDVEYLHYHGIIENWLGNDGEVADLFNRLCQEVVFDINDSYLSELSSQVNKYYDHKWNAWRASLKHNYFGNPWAIISLVAALFLLLLTLAQTFYSINAYYWPRS